MVQRRPLIINSGASQIQELTDSDSLIGNGITPIGGIIMWYGSISNIPSGWALCNGDTVNGYQTPDLRNRFVVGAWSDAANPAWPNLAPNATGGSENAVLIAHSHTLSGGGDNDDVGDNVPASDNTGVHSSTSTVGIDADGNSSTSEDGNDANLPPYYALAYIMRVT